MTILKSRYYKKPPKNNGKMTVEELENSIYILDYTYRECKNIYETLGDEYVFVPPNLVVKLGKYTSIKVASFFDEIWNFTQCLLETFKDNAVLAVTQVALTEYENRFADNHRTRNNVYAHNLRTYTYDWAFEVERNYIIPTSAADFVVIVNLMGMVCNCLHKKYPQALTNVKSRIADPTILDTGITNENYKDILTEIKKKAEDALKNLAKNSPAAS